MRSIVQLPLYIFPLSVLCDEVPEICSVAVSAADEPEISSQGLG